MSSSMRVSLQECFAELTDPRRRKVVYPLVNAIFRAIKPDQFAERLFKFITAIPKLLKSWRFPGL